MPFPHGYPPLRRLTPDDLSITNVKRLSDFWFLILKIEKACEPNIWNVVAQGGRLGIEVG
jgi:hypothetical protein